MISIKNLFGDLQVKPVATSLAPGHLDQPVEIGPDDACFRRIRMHHFQTLKLLCCLLLCMDRHPCLAYFFLQFLNFLGPFIHITQFFFQGLQLLAQIVLPLRLGHLFLGFGLDLRLHGRNFKLLIEIFCHQLKFFLRVETFKDRLSLRDFQAQI